MCRKVLVLNEIVGIHDMIRGREEYWSRGGMVLTIFSPPSPSFPSAKCDLLSVGCVGVISVGGAAGAGCWCKLSSYLIQLFRLCDHDRRGW